MLQKTVVQFNSYMIHATLSHFTDGCVSRVDLKKNLLYSIRSTAERGEFTLIGFGFYKLVLQCYYYGF